MTKTLRRTTLGALLCFAALPGMASAAFTPTVSVNSVDPGCYPKGALAIPVPGAGALPPGASSYKITATVDGTEQKPCSALPSGGAAAYGTFLQWAAAPGATNYKIYRNDVLLATVTPTTVGALGVTCPPTNAADRCQYLDTGGPTTAGAPPALPAANTQAGGHPDLNIVQGFDYAGAPGAGDDPAPNGTTANSASLKDNILHFPAGLLANPTAASATCSINQLIGAPATGTGGAGTTDAGEDKCPRGSQVGTVIASIQSAPVSPSNPPTPTIGDIYLGEKLNAADDVTARLFVALRPPCSQGYPAPLNPGGSACTSRLGGATREVEKSFLSAKATIRQDGTFGIDNETTSVATGADEDLAPVSNIRSTSTGALLAPVPIQVRSLTQNLWGSADQGTAAKGDDKSFVSLPTSCVAKTFSVDAASYLNPALVNATGPLQATGCASVPFSPELTATLDASNGESGQNGNPAFVAQIIQSDDEAATKTAAVTLPEGLGTNIEALGRVCTEAQQNSPTGCPATSQVGSASATTPVLPGTLTGPVYIAENNSPYNLSGLPKLIVSLDGAAKIKFDGAISFNATNTRLVNTFNDLPEVTLSSFILAIQGGDGGLLQNTQNLCKKPLGNIDSTFTGYNDKTVTLSSAVNTNLAYYCVPEPPVIKRKRPGLKVKVRPKNDKKSPFKFTAKGKVIRPKGISKKNGCKGQVRLTLRRKGSGKPLSTTRKKVKSNCKFKVKTGFSKNRLKKSQRNKGKLKAIVRFQGNAVLKAKKVTKQVSYGRKGKK